MTDSLKQYAMEHQVPVMQDEGLEFLLDQIRKNKCKIVLELGTAIARSAIAIANVDPEIQVYTIERNPEMIKQARINIENSTVSDQIHLIEGDALYVEFPKIQYDCIFIDAAKAQYIRFFERYCPFLSQNGIIISDNMNFHGMVQHPELTTNRNTLQLVRKIQKYHEFLKKIDGFSTEFYSLGDGVSLTRRDIK